MTGGIAIQYNHSPDDLRFILAAHRDGLPCHLYLNKGGGIPAELRFERGGQDENDFIQYLVN